MTVLTPTPRSVDQLQADARKRADAYPDRLYGLDRNPLEPDVPLYPVIEFGGKVIYQLQPAQLEAFVRTPLYMGDAAPRHIGYGGAAGGGKSWVADAVAVAVALAWAGSKTILFRETLQAVEENHADKILPTVPEVWNGERMYSYNRSKHRFDWSNGSVTLLAELKDDRSFNKRLGQDYDVMLFEEATQFYWKWIQKLTRSRLRATVPGTIPFAMYLTNPGGVGHFWFDRLFIRRDFRAGERPEHYLYLPARVDDNFMLVFRDPEYVEKLETLDEPYYSWYRWGDWKAGVGTALTISQATHIVPRFDPPEYWQYLAAFDWGFAHPFSFGVYGVNEDLRMFKFDTITGRRLHPDEIAQVIAEKTPVPLSRLYSVQADPMCFKEHVKGYVRATDEDTPTIAEQLQGEGWPIVEANNARIHGLQQLRKYLKHNPAYGGPNLVFLETEGNIQCVDRLGQMVTDPDRLEDVLKVDADEFGEGGDDEYDETRYAVAGRPPPARSTLSDIHAGAWDADVLAYEAEQNRLSKPPASMQLRRKTSHGGRGKLPRGIVPLN